MNLRLTIRIDMEKNKNGFINMGLARGIFSVLVIYFPVSSLVASTLMASTSGGGSLMGSKVSGNKTDLAGKQTTSPKGGISSAELLTLLRHRTIVMTCGICI